MICKKKILDTLVVNLLCRLPTLKIEKLTLTDFFNVKRVGMIIFFVVGEIINL